MKTYNFNELSNEAKQIAFNNNSNINVGYHDWYDCTKEYFHTVLGLIGFYNIDSNFCGFYSQGDGACFSANYRYKKGCLKEIKQYAPNDKELHNIVNGIVSHQKDNGYLLSCEVGKQGNYSHSHTMHFSWCKNDDSYFDWKNNFIEDELEQLLRDLADWYYSKLEKEYDYLTGFDAVAEILGANEIQFDSNGQKYQAI